MASTFIYPKSPNLPSVFYSINEKIMNATDSVLLDSLSGLIARIDTPLIYRTGDSCYNLWLSEIGALTNISIDESFSNDFPGLIDMLIVKYSDKINGIAIYSDISDISLSHAITYCAGSTGVFVVSSASQEYYTSRYGLAIRFDARIESLPDTLNLSTNIVTFQQSSAQLFLVDYAIFTTSPFLSWDDPLREDYLSLLL
jgi:hypothetical protein